MNSFKTAIIAGAVALVALIVTIAVVTNGNSAYGLYISSVSGNVTVSNASDGTNENAFSDTFLKSGDVLTVNDGASCTVIYRTRDNFDENYIVLEPSTQIFVTGKFNGKSDDELYLNRGAVLVNSLEKKKRNVTVRTENASVFTAQTAVRIEYELGEENADTLIASFGGEGNAKIQIYDSFGNPISRDGTVMQSAAPETLAVGHSAKIISGEIPKYDYLNIPTALENYKARVLHELIIMSAFHELSFSSADIKAAYEAAPDDTVTNTEPAVPDEQPTETVTTVTAPPAETEETTDTTTVSTSPIQMTAPPQTTAAPVTTTTAPPVTTTPAPTEATRDDRMITVSILIDDEIIIQEVPYGGNAEQPADPVIAGKRFIGWDGSFENITEEIMISAIFEDDGSAAETTSETEITFDTTTSDERNMLTVMISVNGNVTSQQVAYGGSAVLPAVSIPGYVFMGWDRSPDNITENCTITAILVPDSSGENFNFTDKTYTVTFIVDGVAYPVTVTEGHGAVAPVSPTTNSLGQRFVGWDTDFSNITSDITVNAIFF